MNLGSLSIAKHQLEAGPCAVIFQKHGGIVDLSGARRNTTFQRGFSFFQKLGRRFPVKGFLLQREETALPPQDEFTVPVGTKIALAALHNFGAAARAFANDLFIRGKENVRSGNRTVGLYQLRQHGADAIQKIIREAYAFLNLGKLLFPFGGQKRGLQLLRQDGNQGVALSGGG